MGWRAMNMDIFESMSKTPVRKILIYVAFLFYLSGCGAPSSDGSGSGVSVVPQGDGSALVSWTPPTENTDGSALTDLAGYKIYYGTSSGSYSETVTINSPGLSSYLVENLGAADWYFVMTAVNDSGIESAYSIEVSKLIN